MTHGMGSSTDPYHSESLDDGAVIISRYSLLRYAHIGVEYASSKILFASDVSKFTSPVLLVGIDGFTARQHRPALVRMRRLVSSLKKPVVLSVRADEFVPRPRKEFDSWLNGSTLRAWWSDNPHIRAVQNLDECMPHRTSESCEPERVMTNHSRWHGKIHGWPRGVFSSLAWHRALSQPSLSSAQLVRDRPKLLFCGCYSVTTMGNGPRASKADALRKNGFTCTERCARGAAITKSFEYKFVVSFRGNSAQNWRDWESLLAGAIPLVDYEEVHDDMWEGLPVVPIRHWDEVTHEFLQAKWMDMRRTHNYSWTKLYFPYWLERMLLKSLAPGELKTIQV